VETQVTERNEMPRSLTTHIDNPNALGQRLREAREAAEISQRQLAFPGCTAAYISRLEAGARVPSLQMVNELASRLNVRPAWLARGAEVDPSGMPDEVRLEVERLTERLRECEAALVTIRGVAEQAACAQRRLTTALEAAPS
jgi:transcriptional regulator with XRE-family HTH domain